MCKSMVKIKSKHQLMIRIFRMPTLLHCASFFFCETQEVVQKFNLDNNNFFNLLIQITSVHTINRTTLQFCLVRSIGWHKTQNISNIADTADTIISYKLKDRKWNGRILPKVIESHSEILMIIKSNEFISINLCLLSESGEWWGSIGWIPWKEKGISQCCLITFQKMQPQRTSHGDEWKFSRFFFNNLSSVIIGFPNIPRSS